MSSASTAKEPHVRRSARLAAQKRARSVGDRTESKQDGSPGPAQRPSKKAHHNHRSTRKASPERWVPPLPREASASRAVMSSFMRSYKGLDDWHLPIFRAVRDFLSARGIAEPDVFYPGCHKHVQASLVFRKVQPAVRMCARERSLCPLHMLCLSGVNLAAKNGHT